MRRITLAAVTAAAVAVTFGVVSAGASAQEVPNVGTSGGCGSQVSVQSSNEACAKDVALSATGSATGSGCNTSVEPLSHNEEGTCVSVSGTKSASNSGSCGSGVIGAGAGCVAVSGTGNATNTGGPLSCGSGVIGAGAGCVAVSGTGNATNTGGPLSCGSGVIGAGAGCVAVSGTGNATNTGGSASCGSGILGAGAGAGCVALSGAGNASNVATGPYVCGDANGNAALDVGCVAIGGAGASNSTEGGSTTCGASTPGNPGDAQAKVEKAVAYAEEEDTKGVEYAAVSLAGVVFDLPGKGVGCVALSPQSLP